MGIILDGRKMWIKGDPADTSIKDSFKAEYGEGAHLWLNMIKATKDNFDIIALKFMVGSSMLMKRRSTLALLLRKERSTKVPPWSQ